MEEISRSKVEEALHKRLKLQKKKSKRRSEGEGFKDSPLFAELTSKKKKPKIKTPDENKRCRQSQDKSSIFFLPDDIQFHTFGFLIVEDLATLTCTSHSCRTRVKETLRNIFLRTFGKYPATMKFKNLFWLIRRLHHRNPRNMSELFFWSCAKGYIPFVRKLASSEEDINLMKHGVNTTSKVDGMTAVHIVSKHNQLHILKLLAEATSIDINKLTKSKKHSFQIAAEHGNANIVRFLAEQEDVLFDTRDEQGRTPLYVAASKGNEEILNLLMEGNADPTIPDNHERSPLFIACENGHDDIVANLLEHEDTDVLTTSDSGKSSLYVASEHGHANICRMLLEHGADVRQETCRAKIPLYVAAELGYADVARELLLYTQEEDLFKLTHYGTTPMYIAAKQANKTIKNLFIAFCTNQKKTKERAKQILENRANKRDAGVEEFLGEASIGKRATTPRFMEHMERFHDYNKKQRNKINNIKQSKKKKDSRKTQPDILSVGHRPMSARPFAQSELQREEEIVMQQDREDLKLSLTDFAEQIKAVEHERKKSSRPLSAVMYKQAKKTTKLKLQQQSLIERSKEIKPRKSKKKKRKRKKSKPIKVKSDPEELVETEEPRPLTPPSQHSVDEISTSPRISMNEWQGFLDRQRERENAKHVKRVQKLKEEKERLIQQKEKEKKKREIARKKAARAAQIANQDGPEKPSQNELEQANEEEQKKKELRKRNEELAERARKRRELKQKQIQIEFEEKCTPKKKKKSKPKRVKSLPKVPKLQITENNNKPPVYVDTTPKLPEVVAKRDCVERKSQSRTDSYSCSDEYEACYRSDDYSDDFEKKTDGLDTALRARAKAVIKIFKEKKKELTTRAEEIAAEREKIPDLRIHIEKRKKKRQKQMAAAYGIGTKKKKKKRTNLDRRKCL